MDRLQKKCAIASTGLHLLLLLILLVGPAFFSSTRTVNDLTVLDFVPLKTVDALVSGGGNPNAKPPPATLPPAPQPQPAPPKPQPEQVKVAEPTLPKETVKPRVQESESLEPSDSKPKKQFNFTKTTRKTFSASTEASEADKRAKQVADARRRAAEQIGHTAAVLGNSLSSGTSVELKGPGGGGVPYANFLQAVMSVYDRAWVLPAGASDSDASALVSVTIARDGTVISARIIRNSGNPEVDRSVQSTIDRVRYAAPLPDSAKENQRTVEINFNVKAKRLLG